MGTMRGKFIPRHPEKYMGDPNRIIGRSSWEFRLFAWLDSRDAVLKWGSEEFSIPYLSPVDGKVHQYFPDAFVVYKTTTGEIKKDLIEIKPEYQINLKRNATERDKITWAINQSKWKAAHDFCLSRGFTFRILSEKTLFKQGPKNSPQKKVGK